MVHGQDTEWMLCSCLGRKCRRITHFTKNSRQLSNWVLREGEERLLRW